MPTKLSDLLELAVNDAKKCQRDPRYELDMGNWHSPFRSGRKRKCSVCMAGAVLAQSQGLGIAERGSDHLSGKHSAINCMRIGGFQAAASLVLLTIPADIAETCRAIVFKRYGMGRLRARTTWRDYMRCVRILRKAGY